jgi:hypothetical protein
MSSPATSIERIPKATSLITRVSPYLYLAALLLAAVWCYRNPLYNFDMIPYAAQALLFPEQDATLVHDQVYSALKWEIPGTDYAAIADAPHARDLARDPRRFAEALPFFSTKPLYVMAVYVAYRLGFNLAQATVVPSVLSYALLGVLVFAWIGRYLAGIYDAVFSCLIIFSPPVLLLARLSAPDALSTVLLVAGLYFILEREALAIGAALLLLSIYARTNNLILVAFIFGYLAVFAKDRMRLSYANAGVLLAAGIVSVAAINHFSGFYGWQMLFYTSVIGHTSTPAETVVHISLREYLSAVKQGLFAMVLKGFESMFAFLGFLAIFLLRDSGAARTSWSQPNPMRTLTSSFWGRGAEVSCCARMRIYRHFTIGMLATIPLYFLLLPSSGMWFIEERYFSPQYVFLAVACVIAASRKNHTFID